MYCKGVLPVLIFEVVGSKGMERGEKKRVFIAMKIMLTK